MAKEKDKKPDTPAAGKEKAPGKPDTPAAGKEKAPEKTKASKGITVKVGGTEYTGVCVSKRKTNAGNQVFLKIKGKVSRWFNAKDIVK